MTDEEKVLLKQFQPVTIQDDMMFGTVMADSEYWKPSLGPRLKRSCTWRDRRLLDS